MMHKKTLIVVTGAISLLALLGLWGYLLLFGTSKSVSDIFVNLGLREATLERPEFSTDSDEIRQVALGTGLQQLTTRSVAGFVSINTASSSVIRYTERGTGHVYEIDLTTGSEIRVLATTIAKVTDAYFNPDGQTVVLVSENEIGKRASIHTIGSDSTSVDLPPNSHDFNLPNSTTVRYTKIENDETVAYEFNQTSGITDELWRIPLTQIGVYWSEDRTIIVNDPAPMLLGGVYEIENGQLKQLVEPRYSLTAEVNRPGSKVLYTYYDLEQKRFVSTLINLNDQSFSSVAVVSVPEKCDFSTPEQNVIWCAESFVFGGSDRDVFKEWYQGTLISEDLLWENAIAEEKAYLRVDFLKEAGFVIDVEHLTVSADGRQLFFTNKLNDAMWMYPLSQAEPATVSDVGAPQTPGQ